MAPPPGSARIQNFLPQLDELITEGLVILDDVDVIKYVGRAGEPREKPGRPA